MTLIGIDLAWQSARNSSAAAAAVLHRKVLRVEQVAEGLLGLAAITDFIAAQPDVRGIAIDASLIINNATGQRDCERQLARVYGSRKAGCHPSNRQLYPQPCSVELAETLLGQGFQHLGAVDSRWLIECYPHPALIEIFGLAERYLYKRGSVEQKRDGQVGLAALIRQLAHSSVLPLQIAPALSHYLDAASIRAKRGAALKRNEDALDAIICCYVAGLYAIEAPARVFGDIGNGYIYVPQVACIQRSMP